MEDKGRVVRITIEIPREDLNNLVRHAVGFFKVIARIFSRRRDGNEKR